MTVLPDLEPCAQCDHKRGEHTSTAGGSFNVHPVHYGRCRVTGCDCGEYQPKPTSDQSDSGLRDALAQLKGGVRLLAEELEAGGDPADIASRLHEGCDFAAGVLRLASDEEKG